MVLRDYQIKYRDNIKIGKSNLIISTMGSGKSLILKAIVDMYFQNKKVLFLSDRRSLITQITSYFPEATFIMSGKKTDITANMFLATFQTFSRRRELKLEDFDLICVDEVHEVYGRKLMKDVIQQNCTRVYLTGTPINSKGRFLGKFDNILEFTNMRQMIQDGYLAHTRFLSMANLLSDESEIGTSAGDYKATDIDRVIDKQALIQWVVNDNKTYKWDLNHKTIMYVNSITTAEKIYNKINKPNIVKVIHSKLGHKVVEEIDKWFKTCKNGMLINVRMYTTGADIPTCDTIVNLSPTKILSLYLQSIWRASRRYGDKIATVYDYSGNLLKEGFNPYFNDWYKKPKKSCREECMEFPENSIERDMCLESCNTPEEMYTICDGKPSYSYEQDPYKSNFQTIGTPCKELHPFWEYEYRTTRPKDSIGILHKWSKCPCGFITRYTLETMIQPSKVVEVYSEEVPQSEVMVFVKKGTKQALLITNDLKDKKSFAYKFVQSQEEAYTTSLEYFKGRRFAIISNIPLKKLSNSTSDPRLDSLIKYIDWEDINNQKVIKQLILAKLIGYVRSVGYKVGFAYKMVEGITKDNEKEVYSKVKKPLGRTALLTLGKRLIKED